jgi:signal transduction histidine kinase
VAEAIAVSLRLPYVAVETAAGVTVSYGDRQDRDPQAIPLTHQGQRVGRLLAAGRDHQPPSTRDLKLLTDLARPAGAAVHAAGLADALRASRRRLVQAREEERRRLRRDLHDGLGPTLAGVGLGLDVAATLVEQDPAEAPRLLAELKRETAGAIDDVRRLVYNLRPPALDELGLVSAVRQQVERLTMHHSGLDIRVEASELPRLGAATEVAAYRIALEAVANAARHAGAGHCSVQLTADGLLRLEVVDDGKGIPGGAVGGVGLAAMRERAIEIGGECTVTQAEPNGTRVLALLPLDTP